MGLVEGAALERAHRGLREVEPGVPEVLGERVLQVVVAVEGVLLDHLHVHAGLLRLLHEQRGRGRRDRADVVTGEQLDLQALLAGRLEQRLGLLDVLLALRQVVGVGHVERRVEVVAEPAVATQGVGDHLLAVGDQAHRLAHADVGVRLEVDPHRERHPGAGLGLEDLPTLVLEGADQVVRQVVDRLHLPGLERVDLGARVGEVLDVQLVDERLVAPVVVVLDEDAVLARRERLVLERGGADGVLRVVVRRDDAQRVLGEEVVQQGIGRLELDHHGALAGLLGVGEVEDRRQRDTCRGRRLRVGDAPQREDHVVRRDGLAVVEGDALAQLHRPGERVAGGLHGLGERRGDPVVVVPDQQGFIEVEDARDVGVGDHVVRVETVLAAAAGGAVGEDAARLLRAAVATISGAAPAGGQRARPRHAGGRDPGVPEDLSSGKFLMPPGGAGLVRHTNTSA